ncbi:MFS transporter [Schlesneria sp.]|uniref:MFS transporter n=1 Tax=Schlesneria sp. TaxID=2762018 RepID=UPI002EE0A606
MTDEATVTPPQDSESPTIVRHAILTVLTLMSVLLYLDRFAVNIASEFIREDLQMTQTQMSWFISAFFWSYALCQVPAGWLSDRLGGRAMMTLYIIAWSIFTGLMGAASAVWVVLWLRVFCGAAQAGAYPTSASLIRQWYPISKRGMASSLVGLGGRFGAVLAPLMTAWLILYFVGDSSASKLAPTDVLDPVALLARFDGPPDTATPRDKFISGYLAQLPETERSQLLDHAALAAAQLKQQEQKAKPTPLLELADWVPRFGVNDVPEIREIPSQFREAVDAFAARVSDANLIDFTAVPVRLPANAQRLLVRRQQQNDLSEAESTLLNRSALEVLFPKEIRKYQGRGWRPTIILYGFIGIGVALVLFVVARNHPESHPWCNQAELEVINDEPTRWAKSREPGNPTFPWRAFLTSLSLWGNSLTQFFTNIGWLFVVTSLPRYLDNVHSVPLVTKGVMTAFPSGLGILGLFAGGRATDWAFHVFGLKSGRRIPLVASRFVAAGGYGLCLIVSALFAPTPENWWLPWLYIVGLCIASMSVDFGSPAIWAYAQDVGGRYTASILGWGNMWGNLGAAVAPLVYNMVLGENPTVGDWNNVFLMCCGVFVLSGFCAMLLDSTKPLTVERAS